MEKYIWMEKYSVGVEEIDKQHEHFLEIANEIVKMTGKENVYVQDLKVKANDLSKYAVYHFTTEENLFKHYGYPDTHEHTEAHRAYEEKMDEFIAEIEKEGVNTKKITLELAEFAGSWLVNHIMDVDQRYVEFMHSKGVK